MRILAIETSFDDTACAIVDDGVRVLVSVVSSRMDSHQLTQGVVPEVAARAQVQLMIPVVESALTQAAVSIDSIDAIAVTQGPGLVGSLIVGVTCAQALALLWRKPLLTVNHIWGHLYSNFLGREQLPQLPALIISISGGHNDLAYIPEHGKVELLGQTQDDSAGEAFDKVARMLGLPYPGGPEIEKLAKLGRPGIYRLPRAWLQAGGSGQRPREITDFNFSFSGLKTALYVLINKLGALDDQMKADLAYEFQEAVFDVIVSKLFAAWQKYRSPTVFVSGGVSASLRLRALATERFANTGVEICYPVKLSYCTDNAAMIAAAAFFAGKPAVGIVEPNPHMWLE